MTPPERALWERLRRKQLGVRFHRQAIILGWIADFWCPKHKLVVEVDGSSHETRWMEDTHRDTALFSRRGIRTLRLPAKLIMKDPDRAIAMIKTAYPKITH